MATTPESAQEEQQAQNLQLREALNNAYGFIEGQKTTQTFSAVTFEELVDQQINRLVGPDTESRPNVFNRITKIKNDLLQAVAQIKQLPAESFVDPSTIQNVNTPR